MAAQSSSVMQKPSFKTRFRAWWEGEDPAPEPPKAAVVTVVPASRPAAAPVHPIDRPEIKVPQQVWGEGFTGPGGANFILSLVNPFAVNSESTLMDFGAGLGGGARAVSEKFGVWITGYEPDPDLAAAGQEISMRKGMKKAEIRPYSAQEFMPKAASFDGILSHETLYTLAGKDKLFGAFEHCLKPRGQIAITDFVLAPGVSADDERLGKLTGRAGQTGAFWSDQDYQKQMRTLKFDIRVNEDITANYRSMIIESWVNFTESGGGRNSARNFPDEMVAEVDFWTRRTAAIDSGAVQLRRYHAIKMG
jgi:SAM-dependent methyltransferase